MALGLVHRALLVFVVALSLPMVCVGATDDQRSMLKMINRARLLRGIKPLALNERLCEIAEVKSNDMARRGYRGHISPKYGSPPEMLRHFKVPFGVASENIAWMQPTAESAFKTWMNSSGHRRNMLRRDFQEIGISRDSYGKNVWTQVFLGK